MSPERLTQLREHIRRGNHVTNAMAEELIAEIEMMRGIEGQRNAWHDLYLDCWKSVRDARDRLASDLTALSEMRERLEGES